MGELRAGLESLVSVVWPQWMDRAACADMDQRIFFPEEQGSSFRRAREVCGSCPVADECLEHALEIGETLGIWGGLSPDERAAVADQRGMRRRRRRIHEPADMNGGVA